MKFFSPLEVDGYIFYNNKKYKHSVFITPWSLCHFIAGYICYAFGINYFWSLFIHTLYEFVSSISKDIVDKWANQFKYFGGDTLLNCIGDTVIFILGMLFYEYYHWYAI